METKRGEIIYDAEFGHVCKCTMAVQDVAYAPHRWYENTVEADRSVEPTEGGSYWYVCSRCGAGGWSGC